MKSQTTTMSISLPESLKAFIHDRVGEGHFSNPSDYIRSLVREDQQRQARERLERLLAEGIASGEPVPADDTYWAELLQEAKDRLAARSSDRS